MLTLPIKRKWFDLILSGVKTEEYRNITNHYISLFSNALDENGCFWCVFRNGYSSASPSFKAYVKLSKGYGKEEWGAEHNVEYFILSILRIEK